MTGISFKVTIDDAAGHAELERLIGRMKDRRGFHRIVGEHLMKRLKVRFKNEQAPDGSRWQAHSPVTIANRLKRFGNSPLTILRQSGHLASNFNYEASDAHTKVGTPVLYAAIHHFGGKAGRGHKVTIPARPILGIEPDDPDEIMAMAEDWLTN